MLETRTRYGLPDIVLPRLGGGCVNPSSFVGHDLLVVFCPEEKVAALATLSELSERACDLADRDTWLLAIVADAQTQLPDSPSTCSITVATDADGSAWSAFQTLVEDKAGSAAREGGAYLFSRGGAIAGFWPGTGHVGDVLREIDGRG